MHRSDYERDGRHQGATTGSPTTRILAMLLLIAGTALALLTAGHLRETRQGTAADTHLLSPTPAVSTVANRASGGGGVTAQASSGAAAGSEVARIDGAAATPEVAQKPTEPPNPGASRPPATPVAALPPDIPPGAGVNVRAFGAVGDGAADDTRAIQTAIDTAISRDETVYFPPGRYRVTRTLEFSRPEGRHYASMVGSSMHGVWINYDGDTKEPVLRIRGGFGIEVRDLTLTAADPDRKPAAGIAFPADEKHPSSAQCVFRRVLVMDCKVGFDFNRGTDRQVSEITLENCLANNADEAAFRVEGWNALNYLFLNCEAKFSGVGWWIERTNSVTIVGGSAVKVGTVLRANAGGVLTLTGLRAERSGRLADLGPVRPDGNMGNTGAPILATIRNCSFQAYAQDLAADGHAIRISNPGPTRIEGCLLRAGDIAMVFFRDVHTVLTVEDCAFDKSASHGVKVNGAGNGQLDLRACRIIDWQQGGKGVGPLETHQRFSLSTTETPSAPTKAEPKENP